MNAVHLSTDEKLDLLIRAGALMIENGSVAYRVDETLTALGRALDLTDIEIFATPTGIILGATGPEGSKAKVSRLRSLGVNMNRMAEVSNLAREAASGKVDGAGVAAQLSQIEQQGSGYPTWIVVIGVAIACGALAVLLGGGWQEFVVVLIAGMLTMLVRVWLRTTQLVPLLITIAAAFTATAVSTGLCTLVGCGSVHIAQVAAVLQLAPGVAMVTWVIDMAAGDYLSGITRAAYAALIAMGIALGMLLVLIWGVPR